MAVVVNHDCFVWSGLCCTYEATKAIVVRDVYSQYQLILLLKAIRREPSSKCCHFNSIEELLTFWSLGRIPSLVVSIALFVNRQGESQHCNKQVLGNGVAYSNPYAGAKCWSYI